MFGWSCVNECVRVGKSALLLYQATVISFSWIRSTHLFMFSFFPLSLACAGPSISDRVAREAQDVVTAASIHPVLVSVSVLLNRSSCARRRGEDSREEGVPWYRA